MVFHSQGRRTLRMKRIHAMASKMYGIWRMSFLQTSCSHDSQAEIR